MKHKFFPQQRAPLGQSSSADCPDFYLEAEAGPGYVPVEESSRDPLAGFRGLVIGLIFMAPFWALLLGLALYSHFSKK